MTKPRRAMRDVLNELEQRMELSDRKARSWKITAYVLLAINVAVQSTAAFYVTLTPGKMVFNYLVLVFTAFITGGVWGRERTRKLLQSFKHPLYGEEQ